MFDATQIATLRAVVDRMIPADDAPGGLDAGVDRYLLQLLQHDGVGFAVQYDTALRAIEQEAFQRFATSFAQLASPDADALLHALARNETTVAWPFAARHFIDMMAEHCAEGFYADPRQGGNAGTVSWRMIGFEERR